MGFKIAGVQMRCTPDKDRNLKRAIELGDLAAEQDARVICFQELFHTHWFPRNTDPGAHDLAESIPGPSVNRLAAEARRWNAAVIAPIYERDGDGRGFNAAAVLDAQGDLKGVYRKVHVPHFDLWEERSYFEAGDAGFPVFDVGVARIGVQISWDVFFPEVSRALALNGAQIIVAPTALGDRPARPRHHQRGLRPSGQPGGKRRGARLLRVELLCQPGGGAGRRAQRHDGRHPPGRDRPG